MIHKRWLVLLLVVGFIFGSVQAGLRLFFDHSLSVEDFPLSGYELATGQPLGRLSIKRLDIFILKQDVMVGVNHKLVFGRGDQVYAFGE
jgi:hypothetical protein